MADDKKRFDEFGESLPASARQEMFKPMEGTQIMGAAMGLVLLVAALGGMWSGLQFRGQIFGLFAFNAASTALALVAGVLALYASATKYAAKTVWTIMAVTYAVIAVIGLIVGTGNQVFGIFANNYNNVWAAAAMATVFTYLAMRSGRTQD